MTIIFDVAMFLNHVANYKEGDQALIIADLAALGIDVAAEFADEIIDALKHAKRTATKGVSKGINTSTILESASAARKGGETVAGHALQKHAGRNPNIWGEIKW